MPLILCSSNASSAQSARKGPTATKTVIEKIGTLYGGANIKGVDVDFDSQLRLKISGQTVVSGNFDACITDNPASGIVDRIIVPLTFDNGALVGSSRSELRNTPVFAKLKLSGKPDATNVAGQVIAGQVTIDLDVKDVVLEDPGKVVNDPDAGETVIKVPSFNLIQVKIPTDRQKAFVDFLRLKKLAVSATSLLPTCADLRSGYSEVELAAHPDSANDLISSLNALSGIQAKMAQITSPTSTIRLINKKLDAGLQADIDNISVDVVANVVNSKAEMKREATSKTGEHIVESIFDLDSAQRLGLRVSLSVKYITGFDSNSSNTFVRFTDTKARLVDYSSRDPLDLEDDLAVSGEGDGAQRINTDFLEEMIVKGVAKKLNGQLWNPEDGSWSR